MAIKLLSTSFHAVPLKTRIPFKFGITTMTAAMHLFVRAVVDIDGMKMEGMSADFLPPKWFTKNPATSYEDDRREMMEVITAAAEGAEALAPAETVFDFWHSLYLRQKQWAGQKRCPPLLWNFGVSLVERAVIDAFCRAKGTSFPLALQAGSLGFDPSRVHIELSGVDFRDLLPRQPLSRIIVRHTVGLSDPLTDEEIPEQEKVRDGLPQSLESAIEAYGLTHFKIKLSGNVENDRARLIRLAELLNRSAPNYGFTLDGNENFRALAPFRELWESLVGERSLRDFLSRLIFVEQPIHRDVALSLNLKEWSSRPPIIIDESDAELTSLPTALSAGYAGTSHKNCKGVFKGIANACLLEHRRRATGAKLILSAEDLTNIGPVALMEDLAVVATLGISHAERNGHHYFAGLSAFSRDTQEAVLAGAFGFVRRSRRDRVATDSRGAIDVRSTVDAPFGYGVDQDKLGLDGISLADH